MIREHFINLGFNFAKTKILDAKKQRDIHDRLKAFIERKQKENYSCSLEEEIDFGGLVDYISNDFLIDVEQRLFGNIIERRFAHKKIIATATAYAQDKKTFISKSSGQTNFRCNGHFARFLQKTSK